MGFGPVDGWVAKRDQGEVGVDEGGSFGAEGGVASSEKEVGGFGGYEEMGDRCGAVVDAEEEDRETKAGEGEFGDEDCSSARGVASVSSVRLAL